jgi:hypothetical protein
LLQATEPTNFWRFVFLAAAGFLELLSRSNSSDAFLVPSGLFLFNETLGEIDRFGLLKNVQVSRPQIQT